MAFVQSLVRVSLPTAGLTAAALAFFSQRPLNAEGTSPEMRSSRPGRGPSGDKVRLPIIQILVNALELMSSLPLLQLPIYPLPDTIETITLVETPSLLVPYISQAREATSDALGGVAGYVETGFSQWINFERKVEHEVKTVLPPDERLTPGILYVLISGLTGSVLTRTRSFPLRFLTPPLFTLAALPYFLPKTAHNLRSYLSEVEDKRFPDFAQQHDSLNARVGMHFGMLRERAGGLGQDARGWAGRAREGVESATGLRVGEVVAKARQEVEREKLRAGAEVESVRQAPTEVVGYVVEQRPVAENVRPVEPTRVTEKRIV